MPASSGSYNWTQVAAIGRMSHEALILVGGLGEEPDTEPGETFGYQDGLADDAAAAVREIEREAGRSLEIRGVSAGRGASYVGIAVEVLESLATVGGPTAAVAETARFVRWAYHKIANRTGHRPMVSLGAAEHLAIADLIDQVGSEPHVFGSGDMCSSSPDPSFTGGDAFFVVLATDSELHHYHVSAYGEVFYVGMSPLIPSFMEAPPPYWAGGDSDGS